jgi:hypothetical protein
MAGTGGARPGAGRKRKADKFQGQIQKAEGMIADRLPWLIDKAMELAEGVTVQKPGLTGMVVYQLPPDISAIKYLVDRIMGKPTERRELTLDKPLEEMTEDELRAILES